ncbi:MAG: hypothetical protein K940chlam3_00503 [Chlamydiae bacterium]|nr:hypothetical protein [Chlamydiota bacterium]
MDRIFYGFCYLEDPEDARRDHLIRASLTIKVLRHKMG